MLQLFRELKRRNVYRVAVAYAAVACSLPDSVDVSVDPPRDE